MLQVGCVVGSCRSWLVVLKRTKNASIIINIYVCFPVWVYFLFRITGRGQLKCDGTRAETRFRLSAKRTSPFKSTGVSVQSTAVSRVVRMSGSNAGYTMLRGSVKGTGYPFHSSVSPSFPLPCFTVCHHISTGVYSHIGHKWQYNTTHALCMLNN